LYHRLKAIYTWTTILFLPYCIAIQVYFHQQPARHKASSYDVAIGAKYYFLKSIVRQQICRIAQAFLPYQGLRLRSGGQYQ
jgi:hypothetical protein